MNIKNRERKGYKFTYVYVYFSVLYKLFNQEGVRFSEGIKNCPGR